MRILLPVLAVLLAFVAAGSIIYLAWELTAEADRRRTPEPTDEADVPSDEGPEDKTD